MPSDKGIDLEFILNSYKTKYSFYRPFKENWTERSKKNDENVLWPKEMLENEGGGNCVDYALYFSKCALVNNVPHVFANLSVMNKNKGQGHVVCAIYLNKKWIIVDSMLVKNKTSTFTLSCEENEFEKFITKYSLWYKELVIKFCDGFEKNDKLYLFTKILDKKFFTDYENKKISQTKILDIIFPNYKNKLK